MCMSFRLSDREKTILLATSPLWIPLALVGGLIYLLSLGVVAGVSVVAKGTSEGSGKIKRKASKLFDPKAERRALTTPEFQKKAKRALLFYLLGDYEACVQEFSKKSWAAACRAGTYDRLRVLREPGNKPAHILYYSMALFHVGDVETAFNVLKCAFSFSEHLGFPLPYSFVELMMTVRPDFQDLQDISLQRVLVFGLLYNAVLALPPSKSQLASEMIDRLARINDPTPEAPVRAAAVRYLQATHVGEQSVAAIRSDELRMEILCDCQKQLQNINPKGISDPIMKAVHDDLTTDVTTILNVDQPITNERKLFEPEPSDMYMINSEHHFVDFHVKHPTFCDVCGVYFHSPVKTRMRCMGCKSTIHVECHDAVKNGVCAKFRSVTPAEHRRNYIFQKRRSLLLIWKKGGFERANKDVLLKIMGYIEQ